MRGLVAAALGIALALGTPGSATGHAFLDRADPRVGGRVRAAPDHVTLWFTERLEPAYSSVRVVNGAGERVDKGDGGVAQADSRQLRVSIPTLPAGTYKVIWRVLSVDSHLTEGDFTFRVAP